jgi:hypothetical protein
MLRAGRGPRRAAADQATNSAGRSSTLLSDMVSMIGSSDVLMAGELPCRCAAQFFDFDVWAVR